MIIGNPPYNANQLNENENNKNREYPEIDKRIKETSRPKLGITDSATARRLSGFSTSTKKRNPKTRPSVRSSTFTASRTTNRKYIDLLMRVTKVSVRTVGILNQMKAVSR